MLERLTATAREETATTWESTLGMVSVRRVEKSGAVQAPAGHALRVEAGGAGEQAARGIGHVGVVQVGDIQRVAGQRQSGG